jgi:hypothetical protein
MLSLLDLFRRPFCAAAWAPLSLGFWSNSKSKTSVSSNQTALDASANAAGAQTVTASQSSRVQLDQRAGYVETRGNSTGRADGDGNLILGTGAAYETTYVEQLGDDVVARALDSVDATTGRAFDSIDATTGGAFAFGRSALGTAERAFAGAGAQLAGAVDLADSVARRSAEYADASRLTLERIADPAGSASRLVLWIVGGLVALAVVFLRPRKTKASA